METSQGCGILESNLRPPDQRPRTNRLCYPCFLYPDPISCCNSWSWHPCFRNGFRIHYLCWYLGVKRPLTESTWQSLNLSPFYPISWEYCAASLPLSPCQWGKAYKGATRRSVQERIKEHKSNLQFARTETSTEWNVDIRARGGVYL